MRISVYFGQMVTGASAAFTERANTLAAHALAKHPSCRRIEFLGLNWTDCAQVYDADIIGGVGKADLVFINRDEQSDGIIEEAFAALWKFGLPLVFTHSEGVHISGLLKGTFKCHADQVIYRPYRDEDDYAALLGEAIERFKLDTPNPMRFESIETLRQRNPIFMREGNGVYGNHGVKVSS